MFHEPLNPQWFNKGFAGALNNWVESLRSLSGEAKFSAWRYPIYVSGDRTSAQSGAASIPAADTPIVSEARPVAPFSFRSCWMTPGVVIPNTPFRVHEILCRPRLVIERLPDSVLAVDGDWKSNFQIAHGIFHVHR